MKRAAHEQFAALEREHWWFRGRRRVYLELLRGALGSRRLERALDLGAGVGGWLEELSTVCGELHHTEIDAESLALSSQRGLSRAVRARAEALPYADRSFDLVCLFDVLEHVRDQEQVLAEVLRVLRPEGFALLSVPAYPWLFSQNDRVAQHLRRYTRASLCRELANADLQLVRATYANCLLLPAIIPFVLISEGARRMGLSSEDHGRTNLSVHMPRPLNELCYRAFCSELVLSRHLDLPCGHSLVAIAQRRDLGARPLLVHVAPARTLEPSPAPVSASYVRADPR